MCVLGLKGSTKRGVNLETVLLTRPFSVRKYTPATPWPVDPSFMYLLDYEQFCSSQPIATTCVWYSWCLKDYLAPQGLAIKSISIQPVGCTMSLAAIAQVMQLCTCISEWPYCKVGSVCYVRIWSWQNSIVFHLGQTSPTPSYYPAFAAPPHFPEMVVRCNPGGGGTPLQEANRDVPLDGVAFSRLEWL